MFQIFSVVATDDERIAECCRGFGADVIMTSESCQNGKAIFFPCFTNMNYYLQSNIQNIFNC